VHNLVLLGLLKVSFIGGYISQDCSQQNANDFPASFMPSQAITKSLLTNPSLKFFLKNRLVKMMIWPGGIR
jgi:hypothetical protein